MALTDEDEARIQSAVEAAQPGCGTYSLGCLTILWIIGSILFPPLLLALPVLLWLASLGRRSQG